MGKKVWKTIEGFDDYSISNYGDVWSKSRLMRPSFNPYLSRGRLLKHVLDKSTGYLITPLSKNGKTYKQYVHKLKALHFIKNPKNKPCVNHKNGIKTDNRLCNLEWCTYSENAQHAYDNGLKCSGSDHYSCILIKEDIIEILSRITKGQLQNKIAKDYKVSPSVITGIKQGIHCLQKEK